MFRKEVIVHRNKRKKIVNKKNLNQFKIVKVILVFTQSQMKNIQNNLKISYKQKIYNYNKKGILLKKIYLILSKNIKINNKLLYKISFFV